MRHLLNLLTALGLAGALAMAAGPALGQGASDYRVRDLLSPCVEGDNDSRGGAVLEMECEQYVTGFTDLYLRAKLNERDNVCLPETGNRADEIRWAFMRWAHDNFDQRDIPAVDGLIATLQSRFKCP
jgi:hypothetical protein